MFYYVSFLRPPPTQAQTTGTVSFTPQIANDLRTELYEGSQDIFASWISTTKPPSTPIKLTSWKGQENAYKEMKISVPTRVRSGEQYRLLLTCEPSSMAIDLASPSRIGGTPFPVLSMPIEFTTMYNYAKEKQGHIERFYKLPWLDNEGPRSARIRLIESSSFDLDKKIWDSGIGLSSWLVDFSLAKRDRGPLLDILQSRLLSPETRTVVELGAGTGMLSLTLAALRSRQLSQSSSQDIDNRIPDSIYMTDLESALPIANQNIASNAHLFDERHGKLIPTVLDWDVDVSSESFTKGVDAVIMADVTYNTASFPALVRTLSLIMNQVPRPAILLGYKERDLAERNLWSMAKDVGIEFTKVDEIVGAGGVPVEIWIAT